MTKSIDLKGKIALVTGASRGIGAAVALAYARAGAHVILLARTQGALEEVDDKIRAAGGSATLMPMDLRKLADIDKLGPAIFEKFGRLDIFVGNAAVLGTLTPAHQVNPKDWEKVFDINLTANVRLIKTLDPLLRASEAGRVIFTTSGLAEMVLAYWAPYSASKAALNMLGKVYAAETEQTGMKVNLVDPGIVDTAMLAEAFPGGYGGEMKKPEDVVGAYLELAAPGCKRHGEVVCA
ncbi:MAG TPA: oxidoreductase [Rhodospirillaceae bacterium]|nr:oxidoreductase [Rhodospirillaceae bacterium]